MTLPINFLGSVASHGTSTMYQAQARLCNSTACSSTACTGREWPMLLHANHKRHSISYAYINLWSRGNAIMGLCRLITATIITQHGARASETYYTDYTPPQRRDACRSWWSQVCFPFRLASLLCISLQLQHTITSETACSCSGAKYNEVVCMLLAKQVGAARCAWLSNY